MAEYFGLGKNGAPKSLRWMLYFLKKIYHEQFSKDIPIHDRPGSIMAYEELFRHLGELAYIDGKYKEAIQWYKKGIQFVKETYKKEFVQEELDRYKLEYWLNFTKNVKRYDRRIKFRRLISRFV